MVPEAEWHSKRPTAARAHTNPPKHPRLERQRKQQFHGEQGLRKHTQRTFEVGRVLADGQLYEKRGKFWGAQCGTEEKHKRQ